MTVPAKEKCLPTASDRPKWLPLQNNNPQRIATRSSFSCKAIELSTILPQELSHSQVVNYFPSPPWLASSICTNQVSSTIPGICSHDDPPTHKLEKSLEHISSYQVDYTIYTNSSASAGTRNGGAAAIISTGSPIQPTIASTIKIKYRASKLLPWKLLYSGSPQMPTQSRLPSHLHGQPITMWGTLIMRLSDHLHPFRSSMNFFVTIYLCTPAQAKFLNTARLRITYSRYKAAEMMY